MGRPDPALLEPHRYPLRHTIAPRFQDLDLNNHINNVALSAFFEDARVRLEQAFLREANDTDSRMTMIVSVAIDFLDQIYYPDPVEFHVGILALGRTSWTTGSIGVQHGRVTAFSRAVLVRMSEDGPVPLPERTREAIGNYMIDIAPA